MALEEEACVFLVVVKVFLFALRSTEKKWGERKKREREERGEGGRQRRAERGGVE